MMCQNCTHAGSLNADGEYERAGRLHSECRWPESCTCQHATGGQWQRGKYAAS
jgi:hypothetical protein